MTNPLNTAARSVRSWFTAARQKPTRKPDHLCRPKLEALQDRSLPSGSPPIGDVFYIELENHNLTQPTGLGGSPGQLLNNPAAPYLNSLMTPGNPNAAQTSYASNYYNVQYNNPAVSIHPSEPNYIWQEAGLAGPLNDNDPYPSNIVDAPNLSALLQSAGVSWKSYQEDIDLTPASGTVNQPGANALTGTVAPQSQWTVPLGSFGGTSPAYTNPYNASNQYNFATKHDGHLFFTATNGGNDPSASNPEAPHYAPLQQLQTDLTNGTAARYNLITPDQYNDMHNSLSTNFTYNGTTYTPGDQEAIAVGDNFLSRVVPLIEASQAYKNNGAIVIRSDESEGGNSTAYTLPEVVISPLAKGNAYNSTLSYTHSSDLKSLQELFGVTAPGGGFLGDANTPGTNDLSDFFNAGALSPATPPTGLALSNAAAPALKPAGAVVGTLSATEAGTGHTLTYALVPGAGADNNAAFAVNGTQLVTAAPLVTAATVRVRVTDEAGQTFDQAFAITPAFDPGLSVSGSTLTVSGTAGNDAFTFAPGATDAVTLNGVGYVAPAAQIAAVVFTGNGGSDTAAVTTAGGGDTAALSPTDGRVAGPGYEVVLHGVANVTVAGGGNDSAALAGAGGTNAFVGSPGVASLNGPGYRNTVTGFSAVVAYSHGTGDRAALADDAAGGGFVGTPGYAYLTTPAGTNEAVGFGVVVAYAHSGKETAALADGPSGGAFVGTTGYSYLTSNGAGTNEAVGFGAVLAFGRGAGDTAAVADGGGGGGFVGTPGYSYLTAGGVTNEAVGFGSVLAFAHGQNDRADVADGRGGASLAAGGSRAVLVGANFGYSITLDGFGLVNAYGTGGNDHKYTGPVTYQLNLGGDWA